MNVSSGSHLEDSTELLSNTGPQMKLSIFLSRQSGARAAAHLQPDRPVWHFDPVCASGCPHRCDADRPHRALPCESALGSGRRSERKDSDNVPLLDLCVPAGAESYPADAVPHQSLQLAAPHRHRYHPAQFHQHTGDFRSQHLGNLRHHRWEHHSPMAGTVHSLPFFKSTEKSL